MPKYVALLRAVNVGGNNMIKMDALKEMFFSLKFKNVVTYIQSGNIIFETKETEEGKLLSKIEKEIAKVFGLQIDVFLRSEDEVKIIIDDKPFLNVEGREDVKLNVSFLAGMPDEGQAQHFMSLSNEVDTFILKGRELFTVTLKEAPKSLLSDALIKKHLKLKATTRNWNTVNKLNELLKK